MYVALVRTSTTNILRNVQRVFSIVKSNPASISEIETLHPSALASVGHQAKREASTTCIAAPYCRMDSLLSPCDISYGGLELVPDTGTQLR